MEDVDIASKTALDIQRVHVYLHNLQNWYGTGQEEGDAEKYVVHIEYGALNARTGKFDVKDYTRDEQVDTVRGGPDLQMFHDFRYAPEHNHVRVTISTLEGEQVCHSTIDLRGLQRNKFVVIQQIMNSKEFTSNTESTFSLAHVKASVFLQQSRSPLTGDKAQYLQSARRPGDITLNTNTDLEVQKKFQEQLAAPLQRSIENDYRNLRDCLDDEAAVDAVTHRYKFADLEAAAQSGDLDPNKFKAFVQEALTEQSRNSGPAGIDELISALQKAGRSELAGTRASLASSWSKSGQSFLSLRDFVLQVLFNSPLTIKEKLDVIYDTQNASNRFTDGVDLQEATLLYYSILNAHMYHLNYNELLTATEHVLTNGVSGVLAAFWTRKSVGEIKFEMDRSAGNGCLSAEDFLGSLLVNTKVAARQLSCVDVTGEVQATIQQYINLYGGKVFDFNSGTSPFANLNALLLGTGDAAMGDRLLSKTRSAAEYPGRFRMCLICELQGAERAMIELKYNTETGELISAPVQEPSGANRVKNVLMQNQNVVDLSSRQRSLTKTEFFATAKRLPFVYDCLRQETMWQDRQATDERYGFKEKRKYRMPAITVFLHAEDKILAFRFQQGRSPSRKFQEVTQRGIDGDSQIY
jgi:hypothetical protein